MERHPGAAVAQPRRVRTTAAAGAVLLVTGCGVLEPEGMASDSAPLAETGDASGPAGAARLGGGPVATLGEAYTGAGPGEQLGFAMSSAGDFDGDGLSDLLVGAFGNGRSGHFTGAAYLVRGSVTPSAGSVSSSWPLFGEAEGDEAGRAVAGAGDVDGDGLHDVVVGAWHNDGGGGDSGAAYLVLGATGAPPAALGAAVRYAGPGPGHRVGFAVAGGVDVDGDGLGEVVVTGTGGGGELSAYVVTGRTEPRSLSLGEVGALSAGTADDDDALLVDGLGDVDGDGLDDLVLGQPGAAGGALRRGAAYLVLGEAPLTSMPLADAVVLSGEAEGDAAGFAVSRGGDVDGDGHLDLLVGAPGRGSGGALSGSVYVVLGQGRPESGSLAGALELPAPMAGDMAGQRLAGGLDLDLDGFCDVLVGVDNTDQDRGASYLLYGAAQPPAALAEGAAFTGTTPGDQLGSAGALLPDFTGDGLPDFALGAVGYDDNRGAAYVVPGAPAP